MLAHDIVQTERLQLGQRRSLGRRDVGLTDIGSRIEDIGIRRRDVHVATHDGGVRTSAEHCAQRGEPGQLVLVVVGVRHPSVRRVDRGDADPGAGRRHGARLGQRKSRPVDDAVHHVVQANARENRHSVPLCFTV